MTKQEILDEIRAIAAKNAGKPPGEKQFTSQTGVRNHQWRGKFWVKWADAVREAGFEPNKWVEAIPVELLIEMYALLARELGHLPTDAELLLKTNSDPSFPSIRPFRRFKKAELILRVREYCSKRSDLDDVLSLCAVAVVPPSPDAHTKRAKADEPEDAFVYLLKSGRYFKIGRSVATGQRARQLKIQLPERAETIHSIRTDDPIGIEAYWHKRFAEKRKNGEWFDLDRSEVLAFKKRKFM